MSPLGCVGGWVGAWVGGLMDEGVPSDVEAGLYFRTSLECFADVRWFQLDIDFNRIFFHGKLACCWLMPCC